ncbi:hypothetical protein FWH09_03310 [Candidatus Saccharibacteria bacterium]|nr:hypothetical protein [Candidatus Saccharibacteria bacterium]
MRIVLVYNQKSSGYSRVLKDIIEPVRARIHDEIIEYNIEPSSFEQNAEDLGRILEKNDLVIVAGGDGTASIAANAILQFNVEGARMAVFGYGNFNDFQSNFGLKKRDLGRILRGNIRSTTVRPAEIILDGEFWRFATLYFTAGLLAKSTEVFEEHQVRATISRKRHLPRLLYSLTKLKIWFWRESRKNRRGIYQEVNGQKITDFGVMIGKKMARVLRARHNYLGSWQVGVFSLRLSNLWKAGMFVLGGILFGVPIEGHDEVEWKISSGNGIWLQTEGEGAFVENVKIITAKKSDRTIEIII